MALEKNGDLLPLVCVCHRLHTVGGKVNKEPLVADLVQLLKTLASYSGQSSKRRQALVDLHAKMKRSANAATTAASEQPVDSMSIMDVFLNLESTYESQYDDAHDEVHDEEHDDSRDTQLVEVAVPDRLLKIPTMGATRWLSVVRSSSAFLRNYPVLLKHFELEMKLNAQLLLTSSSKTILKAHSDSVALYTQLSKKSTLAGMVALNTVPTISLLCTSSGKSH